MQSNVDVALAAFAAAHNVDIGIFCSAEWLALLEAINLAPLPPLEECYEPTAAVLLARAAIHRNQVCGALTRRQCCVSELRVCHCTARGVMISIMAVRSFVCLIGSRALGSRERGCSEHSGTVFLAATDRNFPLP